MFRSLSLNHTIGQAGIIRRVGLSELVREDVAEFDLQLVHQGFELVDRYVSFAKFKPLKHAVRDACFLGELGIGHFTACFSQVFGQLSIKAFSHPANLANKPSPMGDVVLDSTSRSAQILPKTF